MHNDGALDSVEFTDDERSCEDLSNLACNPFTTLGPVTRRNGSRFDWKFGVFDADGSVSCLADRSAVRQCWTFRGDEDG